MSTKKFLCFKSVAFIFFWKQLSKGFSIRGPSVWMRKWDWKIHKEEKSLDMYGCMQPIIIWIKLYTNELLELDQMKTLRSAWMDAADKRGPPSAPSLAPSPPPARSSPPRTPWCRPPSLLLWSASLNCPLLLLLASQLSSCSASFYAFASSVIFFCLASWREGGRGVKPHDRQGQSRISYITLNII